jgi:hypothetical protein
LTKNVTNLAASVRQRLANRSRERKEDFGLLLTKYALERLLFRIGQSEYRKIFVLKGALLFELWTEEAHRPTRDADFLSNGDSDPSRFESIFKEICALPVDEDGLQFDPASVKAQRIKEDADYEGVRVTFLGYLERARIPMQIDIGFGDTITPPPVETSFPTILNGPAPSLFTYPKETVVAEKFEAMVKLGIANSRMKDFHDIRALSELFSFDGPVLADAIVRTFERRKTALPTISAPPRAYTSEYFEDESRQRQWGAFNIKNRLYIESVPFRRVVGDIERFLMPLVIGVTKMEHWNRSWPAGGPWQD